MLASQRQSGQGSVVTDAVGNSSRYVDAAQGLRGLVVGVWGNGIFLPGQGPQELEQAELQMLISLGTISELISFMPLLLL